MIEFTDENMLLCIGKFYVKGQFQLPQTPQKTQKWQVPLNSEL
jgi:hypothetical protein